MVPSALADQTIVDSQDVQVNVGDELLVGSDHASIQRVFVVGNLSSASLSKQETYPTGAFTMTAFAPGSYYIRVLFNYTSAYSVNVMVESAQTTVRNNTSTYYLSGGSFELDLNATFVTRQSPPTVVVSSESPWDSFVGWMGNFSEAFPLWVKLLYLGLGLQFFVVGGLWIKRESSRKEGAGQHLDSGNKAYLLLDITYKFLLVSFVSILVIMGGELLILFILRFMFLVSINLLSLWDLFVVGFAAGIVVMTYLIRFALERGFDLKPLEDE
jgi:hypothetical protein